MASRKTSSRKSRSKVLTLAQLKDLAKSHGIQCSGLKKATLKAKLTSHHISVSSKNSKLSKKKSRAPCKSGQVRDRSSGKCRKRSAKKSRAPCKSGQVRDRSSGKCRKRSTKRSAKKPAKKSRAPCKSGQVRDRSSGKCRKRLVKK